MGVDDYIWGNSFKQYGNAFRINKVKLRVVLLALGVVPVIFPLPIMAIIAYSIKKDIVWRYE